MLRDGKSGDWIGTFTGHKGAVWSCRLDPTGSLAATASGDFSVQVWDAITGKSLYTFPHKHIVKSCDFSPNSKRLATGGHEGILRIYNLLTPQAEPWELDQNATSAQGKITITKLCWWTDHTVCVGCADGMIRFWDVSADGVPKQSGTAPTHVLRTKEGMEIRDMELTKIARTGREVLTVAAGSKVYFFDLRDRSLIHAYTLPIHFREEGGASLHPDGTKFVAGGSDLWVRVVDFDTGKELDCLKGHHGPIRCLRYSPDGHTFASGSEDGTIRLWKTNPEQEDCN